MLAYLAAPEFWTLRDRNFRTQRFEMVTHTPQGIAGDPINVGLVGTKKELVHAFAIAGWDTADALTLETAVEIGESVLFDRPYPDAPVSRLLFEGRAQDLPSRSRSATVPTGVIMSASGRPMRPETMAGRSGWVRQASIAASASATTPARSHTISVPTSTPSATC